MQHQSNLKGEDTEPWKGICCEACWNAEAKWCSCKCGGRHHGEGIGGAEKNKVVVVLRGRRT